MESFYRYSYRSISKEAWSLTEKFSRIFVICGHGLTRIEKSIVLSFLHTESQYIYFVFSQPARKEIQRMNEEAKKGENS